MTAIRISGDIANWYLQLHAIAVNHVVTDYEALLVPKSVGSTEMTTRLRDKVLEALFGEKLIEQETKDNTKT